MPIHIAITRRVRPGCEAEFQQALREFFQTSFAHGGVWGASMLTPPPGSDSREYGILRTFANEQTAADSRSAGMVAGESVRRLRRAVGQP